MYEFKRAAPPCPTRQPPPQDTPVSAPPPSPEVTILRHCRCADCRNFSQADGANYCREGIGGTFVVWATGKRVCEPAPDAWHYCSHYEGPQISKDVWVWHRKGN